MSAGLQHQRARTGPVLCGLLVSLLVSTPLQASAAPPAAVAGEWVVTGPSLPAALLDSAPSIEEVRIEGNDRLSDLELSRAVDRVRGRPLTQTEFNALVAGVLAGYRRAGHFGAEITAVTIAALGHGVSMTAHVREGPPVTVGGIEIQGATLYTADRVRELIGMRSGEPFDLDRFEAGVARLLDAYENSGRPFAAVEPRDLHWTDTVSMTLAIDEGAMIRLGRVEVRGNSTTRQEVIERIAGLETGAPFRQRDMEVARARLERSGLFRAVEPIELAQDADRTRGVVLIRVREGLPNRVAGVVGYSGVEQGITGLFHMELGNIAGTGRRARLRWEGRGAGVSLFDLGYAEPWLFGTPLTLELALGRTVQDTLYTLNDFEVVGDLALSPEWRAGVGWQRESTLQPAGAIRSTVRNALIVRSEFDSRDSRLNPRRGILLRGEVRLGRKALRARAPGLLDQRVRVQTVELGAERAQAWSSPHVSFMRGGVKLVTSDEETIPFYELYPLGGATTLRGYREEQFRGSGVGLFTFEQRFILDAGGSRIFGFSDVGIVSTRRTSLTPPGGAEVTFHVGYGAGLRLATRLGLVGVDYGIGDGDSPLGGKIHFLLEAAF